MTTTGQGMLLRPTHRVSSSAHTRTRCGVASNDAWPLLEQECLSDDEKTIDLERLQSVVNRMQLTTDNQWWQWIKATPCPLIVNWSQTVRCVGRVLVLPSGMPLTSPLYEPDGTVVIAKLLSGAVSLSSGRQKNKKQIQREGMSSPKDTTWILSGGTDRMYHAMDTGPAVLFEVLLLPSSPKIAVVAASPFTGDNLCLSSVDWPTEERLQIQHESMTEEKEEEMQTEDRSINNVSSIQTEFQSSLGGLKAQIDTIVRRVLDGRVLLRSESSTAALEACELACLGLVPVRGLLLYGPPGCGKTALARELARVLRARDPKIVAAPELLDRWVGGSEKLVRALFQDAEAELAACQGDATKSTLHVIVIDEIDAVFRKRTSSEDSGETTRSSVVNQILSKLDGVQAIPNVLMIGMTNRKELLDDALLRPGRLEVQIEIPMPDRNGRREILAIHFGALRRNGRLCVRLCGALDGQLAEKKQLWRRTGKSLFDLASDRVTGGFSGADLAGLVRCAGSIALARARNDGSGVDGLFVTLDDVQQALIEIRQSRVYDQCIV